MKCKKCGGKGYVDSHFAGAATFTPQVQQCSERCNLTGYSNEVQRRLKDKNRVTAHQVIPAPALPYERPRPKLFIVRRRPVD